MGSPEFPQLACKTGHSLGCGWNLVNLGILVGYKSPPVLFLYDDQRWASFYFAPIVAFLELHLRSGEHRFDVGTQKADAP